MVGGEVEGRKAGHWKEEKTEAGEVSREFKNHRETSLDSRDSLWASRPYPSRGLRVGGGISVKEITYWPAPCDGCKFLLSVPARSVEVWDFFARGCCEALPEVPRGIIACAL